MDSVIYLALIVFWTVIVSLIGFGKQKKSDSAIAYFSSGRSLRCISALSCWLADVSLFAIIIVPALSFASVRGIKQGIIVCVAVIFGGLISWFLIARRLRVYAEVTASVTLPEYIDKRFKSPSGVSRTVAAIIGAVLCCIIAGFAFSVAVTFCDVLFHVGRVAGIMLCAAVVIIVLMFGGLNSVTSANMLQTVFLLVALVFAVIFTYLGNEPAQLSVIYDNLGDLSDMFPRIFGDYYHLSVFDILSALGVGACWFGLPHILTYYMSGRDKRLYRRTSNICLICSVCALFCSVLLGIFAYPVGGGDAPVLLQGLNLIGNPYLRSSLIVIFFFCVLSIGASYIMTAATYIAYDLYPRIRKTKAPDISIVVKIVTVSLMLVIALIAWDPKMSAPSFLVVALECFAAAFGPVILFSLYSPRITHKGSVCCMISGVCFTIGIRLLTVFVFHADGYFFYEMLPSFLFASLCLWGVSAVDNRKERREVALEFDRVSTIMKCRNQFHIK